MKLNEDELLSSLKRIIRESEFRDLTNTIVYQDEYGRYQLFNRYEIKQEKDWYTVTKAGTHTSYNFYSLKNAVTWATLDKRGLILDSFRVHHLDGVLSGLEFNIKMHDRFIKKSKDSEDKLLHIIKLKENKVRKNQVLKELSKFIDSVKTWQLRQFKEQFTK